MIEGAVEMPSFVFSTTIFASKKKLGKGALSGPVPWREAFPMANPGDVENRPIFVAIEGGGEARLIPTRARRVRGGDRQAQGLTL